MAEFFYDIRPSYSCAWVDDQAMAARVRSKLADYGGDAARQLHDRTATANMLAALADGLRSGYATLGFVQQVVDRAFRAEHTPSRFVTDPAERNPQ